MVLKKDELFLHRQLLGQNVKTIFEINFFTPVVVYLSVEINFLGGNFM